MFLFTEFCIARGSKTYAPLLDSLGEREASCLEQRPGPGHSFQDDAQESSPISSGPSTRRPGLDPGLPLTWEVAHHSVPL